MAISAEAERNHDALFPNHKSTLKVTDPELVEVFDNWAFDEVLITSNCFGDYYTRGAST